MNFLEVLSYMNFSMILSTHFEILIDSECEVELLGYTYCV